MNEAMIEIIQPDDWHIHLRHGEILTAVTKYSSRINNRCIVMPNIDIPITTSYLANKYKNEIKKTFQFNSFTPLIPCYLIDTIDVKDFEEALKNIQRAEQLAIKTNKREEYRKTHLGIKFQLKSLED